MAAALTFVLAVTGLFVASSAISDDDYSFGRVFHGDGTYYGKTEKGNCAIRRPRPAFYRNYVPVAINDHQYEGMCGACIEVTGKGKGSGANPIVGTFKAYVMDRCPECKFGDIDLSKPGDGRWKVSWKVIPCQGARRISFQFEGSNRYYLKFQPRGMKSPAKKVKVNGIECEPTQDNHWIAQNSGGFRGKFKIVVWTVLGARIESWIDRYHGVVYGSVIGGGSHPKPDIQPAPKPWTPPSKPWTPPAKCVPKWYPCTGPKNTLGTSKCCDGWQCKWAAQKDFVGKRCEPVVKPAACVPKWHPCTGPKNYFGTSNCCNGWKCKWPAQKSFVGKRCEPARKPATCVPRWKPCSGRNNVYGTSKCCEGWECSKPAQKDFVGRRCEPVSQKYVGCRRAWERCGTFKRWTKRNGRPMWGKHCCPQGFVCKWASDEWFGGFRCEKWQESFRKWYK